MRDACAVNSGVHSSIAIVPCARLYYCLRNAPLLFWRPLAESLRQIRFRTGDGRLPSDERATGRIGRRATRAGQSEHAGAPSAVRPARTRPGVDVQAHAFRGPQRTRMQGAAGGAQSTRRGFTTGLQQLRR